MAAHSLNRSTVEQGLSSPIDGGPRYQLQNEKPNHSASSLARWNAKFMRLLGLEERGIARVLPEERYTSNSGRHGYLQMTLLWFSANITANNLAVGLLGPLVYELSFLDSALCAVFGCIIGAAGASFMSTYGPASGNRTMVVARFFMGYYPSKICCLLNIIIMLGYGLIDCIIGGQILSAVSNGTMSVVVGIIINALITWIVAAFGMSLFHLYERYAFIPQVIVLFILVGVAGPKFNTSFSSTGNAETITANRLSFLGLCLSGPVAWSPSAADYYCYYPVSTSRILTFFMTLIGMTLSFSFVYLLGIGLASGTFTQPDWNDAYGVSSGALILQGYAPLGAFGKFCGVIVALGVIANNIPGTYSAALGMQVMGRWLQRVPRWTLTCVSVLIYTVCALAGRSHLFGIFENFLALMGYWVCLFLGIVIEEEVLFNRGKGHDWSQWSNRKALPVGVAALCAFLVGWAGAIVSMDQVWYVGPIAKRVGDAGADLGIWIGTGWTLLVYPPLRYIELKRLGR